MKQKENIMKKDSNAKVIMVTADTTQNTRDKLISMNASSILYKPYEIDVVIETINDVLEGNKNLNSPREQKSKYIPWI